MTSPIEMEDVCQAAQEETCEVCKGFIMGECTVGEGYCEGFQKAVEAIKAGWEAESEKAEGEA